MSDQTYTTDLNVMSGSVHVELTDAEMAGWFRENVRLPLFAQMLALMDEHGAQQVLVAAGFASSVDLWRRDHPDRWATVMEGGAGIGQRAQQPAAAEDDR